MVDEVLERFWDKISVQFNGCWLWMAYKNKDGYPQFRYNDRMMKAHRFAYEVNKGKILEGLTLDHLCKNRGCVNPEHLEPVTLNQNIMRGNTPCAINARKTHCPRGHPYLGENLIIQKNGKRYYRACKSLYNSMYREARFVN